MLFVLKIVPVTTLKQALVVRQIRNACREYMTRDQSKVSFFKQLRWWFFKPKTRRVVMVTNHGYEIGYGVINGNEITGCILKDWRGEGAGRFLFEYLTREVPKPGSLEVLSSNIRARRLYESLGWKYVNWSKWSIGLKVREMEYA